jgi:predicted ArsR family transcriptional regulator
MSTQPSLRESVIAFMAGNPVSWSARELAAKLRVGVEAVGHELARLSAEGKLVSCTVLARGREPQKQYRIAAVEQKYGSSQFVISKKSNAPSRTKRRGGW